MHLTFPPQQSADRWNYPFGPDSDQSSRWAAIWPIIWVDFRYAFHQGRCQDPNLSSNMATTIPRESGNEALLRLVLQHLCIQIIPPTKATIRAIFRKLHTRPVKGPFAPGAVSHVSAVARSTLPWTDLHANFTLTWAREPQFAVNNGYSATLEELGIDKRNQTFWLFAIWKDIFIHSFGMAKDYLAKHNVTQFGFKPSDEHCSLTYNLEGRLYQSL